MTDPAAVAIETIRFTVFPSLLETNDLSPPLQPKAGALHPPPVSGRYLVIWGIISN
jgi:hypothetical protein